MPDKGEKRPAPIKIVTTIDCGLTGVPCSKTSSTMAIAKKVIYIYIPIRGEWRTVRVRLGVIVTHILNHFRQDFRRALPSHQPYRYFRRFCPLGMLMLLVGIEMQDCKFQVESKKKNKQYKPEI